MFCKIICYTNVRVKWWNDIIRLSIFKEDSIDKLDIVLLGETLTGYTSYEFGIKNSACYVVKDIKKSSVLPELLVTAAGFEPATFRAEI